MAVDATHRARGASPRPDRVCVTAKRISFTDPAQAPAAAALCTDCTAGTACLLSALTAHAAHRDDRTVPAAYGCYAGIWFQPGAQPRSVDAGGHLLPTWRGEDA